MAIVNKDNRCDVTKINGVVDSSFAVLEQGIATLFTRLSSGHPGTEVTRVQNKVRTFCAGLHHQIPQL